MITLTKKHTFAITISDNINFKEQITKTKIQALILDYLTPIITIIVDIQLNQSLFYPYE